MTNINHTLEINSFHALATADAQKYGTDAALILFHLRFWLDKNRQAGRNIKDGFVWSYQTSEYIHQQLPYLSQSKIKRILTKLVKLGVLLRARYNKFLWDRTWWFSMPEFAVESTVKQAVESTENALKPASLPIVQIEPCIVQNEPPIPDTKTSDKKTLKPTTSSTPKTKTVELESIGSSVLTFNESIKPEQRPAIEKAIVKNIAEPDRQAVVDVLTVAVVTGKIKSDPMSYLFGLIKRWKNGEFSAEPAKAYQQRREQEIEAQKRVEEQKRRSLEAFYRQQAVTLTTQPKQPGQGHKDFIAACRVILA